MSPATKVPSTSAPSAPRARSTKATAKRVEAPKAAAKNVPAPAKKAAAKAPGKKAAAKSLPAPAKAPAKAAVAAAKVPVKKVQAAKATPEKRPSRAKPPIGPYASDTKFLEEQRLILLSERAVYQEQAEVLKAEADSLAQEREPGDVQFDEESGEGGTVTVDRERDLALSAQASLAVEEIEDSLVRITRKTYGACERCHQPIMKARLRALPYARLCVACKSGGLSRR